MPVRALALAALAACTTGPEPLEIPFEATFGGEPFRCDGTFAVGTTATQAEVLDLRLYLHDVAVVHADGTTTPVELDASPWQRDGVALLDFEDDSGACETGSAATNTSLTGLADLSDVAGLTFTLGVPEALNHVEAATAAAPLNAPGMWWSWQGGLKFARIDLATPFKPTFFFHLGATACAGTPAEGFSCANANRPTVTLDGWSPGDGVTLDVAALYDDLDVTAPEAEGDALPGCMSFPGDPQCAPMFHALGLDYGDAPAPAAQRVFSVTAP